MQDFQTSFLRLALQHEVLRFGSFTLKSGRVSPYFFNLGRISSGAALRQLAASYAAGLQRSGVEFDMLFGPAYKGIPLVAATACALADHGVDVPYAYNRKEAKEHGEGGVLVGHPPEGKVVIVDDVLTAGTALREAIGLLRQAGAEPVAAIVALDRQEVGPSGHSAVTDLQATTGVRIVPLVTVSEVMRYLETDSQMQSTLASMRAYQAEFGVSS